MKCSGAVAWFDAVVNPNPYMLVVLLAIFCPISPPNFSASRDSFHRQSRPWPSHLTNSYDPTTKMGWLDGWFGSSSASQSSDPLGNLDPKVREFLAKESPVKYSAASDLEKGLKEEREKQHQERLARQKEREEAKVPRESLYQDGRYAHLWKTYRPLAAIEGESKSDHEKLMDVLDGYKERKNAIGRAALENCADEQLEWNLCMKEGDWAKRARMCSEEVRRFERCYLTQSVSIFEIVWQGVMWFADGWAEVVEGVGVFAGL